MKVEQLLQYFERNKIETSKDGKTNSFDILEKGKIIYNCNYYPSQKHLLLNPAQEKTLDNLETKLQQVKKELKPTGIELMKYNPNQYGAKVL